jgi:acyl dehydratase
LFPAVVRERIKSVTLKPVKYYEDFEDGFVFEFEVPGLTEYEIIDFARDYDPQRFHLDPSGFGFTFR